MEKASSSSAGAIEKFLDRHINILSKQDLKDTAMRWYVVRAEQYIRAHPDKRLGEHGPEDVVSYF